MYFQFDFWRRQRTLRLTRTSLLAAPSGFGLSLAVALGMLCTVQPTSAATAVLRGDAMYLARMQPPPNAVLIVTLEEVSRADARSREIASVQMALKSGPPYGWRMAYDKEAIDGIRHVLRARILVGDKLFMSTDQVYPALAVDAERRPRLMLRRVQAAPAVAPPAVPDAALQGTYWRLTELGGQPVSSQAGRTPEAHLVLHTEGRVAGSDGCNRLMGSYTLEAGQLWFERLAGTKMMCPATTGSDIAFTRALLNANAWRVTGNTLELMAGREPVARFAAVALN